MAVINAEGMFNGERLRACTDEAQLHWPRFLTLSNSFGRFEVDYGRIVSAAYSSFKAVPTFDQVMGFLKEYQDNYLLFIYTAANGSLWAEWTTEKENLRTYHSKADSESPSPDLKMLEAFRQAYVEFKNSKKAKLFGLIGVSKPSGFVPIHPEPSGFISPGAGIGVGIGVGKGNGAGEPKQSSQDNNQSSAEHSAVQGSVSSTSSPSETKTKTSSVRDSVLATIRSSHFGGAGPLVHENDPLFPYICLYTEQAKASFSEDEWPDDTYLSQMDRASVLAWSTFVSSVQMIRGIAQYLPDLHHPTDTEGMIEFRMEDIESVMKGMCGFPGSPDEAQVNCSLLEFWAKIWWAFTKSDHWPNKLKTLADVILNWKFIDSQYGKYYGRVPDGKKPHDLNAGVPPKAVRDDEEDDNVQTTTYRKGPNVSFDDDEVVLDDVESF